METSLSGGTCVLTFMVLRLLGASSYLSSMFCPLPSMYVNSASDTASFGFNRHTYSVKPARVVPSAKCQVLRAPSHPIVSWPPFHAASAGAHCASNSKTTTAKTL